MDNNSNLIMHQNKTSEDFDVVIDDHGSQKTEAIYQQNESEGKVYQDLDNLLQHHKYENAIRYVYDQKFELERGSYYQLGEWLVKRLQADKDIDPALLSDFVTNMNKYKQFREKHWECKLDSNVFC